MSRTSPKKRRRREWYCLPTPGPKGETYTTDWNRYVKEWRAIGIPVSMALNARLHGFDPGFTFFSNADGSSIELTTRAAVGILQGAGK